MKKIFLLITALLIISLIWLLSVLRDYHDTHVDAIDLALFRIKLQAVDSETNIPIDAKVWEEPSLMIQQKMKGVYVTSPIVMESFDRGIIEVTWLDLKDSKESIKIHAGGYVTTAIPLRYREVIQGVTSSSLPHQIYPTIKLTKSNNLEQATPRKPSD